MNFSFSAMKGLRAASTTRYRLPAAFAVIAKILHHRRCTLA
jgi:hypothetical protein